MVKEYFKKIKELGIGKLMLILLAGILLVLSCMMEPAKSNETKQYVRNSQEDVLQKEDMESSMEQILAKINGVKAVKVMITYENSGEKVLVSSQSVEQEKTNEQDSGGGTRVQEKQNTSEEYLYAGEEPYVVMEITPKICGVLVVYEGNGSNAKDIAEAVKVLTGVDYNRIKVLLMN